ncbi:hypothetical protein [Azorhizobium doebereinerae]|uniref:hypothetical protein n=1 Tax=Azorhizobium doebereinerae TaxID=281091 RepID=UPI00048F18E6|nr:hypothetical protein [Azorhizobium doebereinerae]
MHARHFEMLLQTLSGRTASDLDLRFRELRKMRMLPTGGRGRHAPDIDAEQASTILIGVAGASRASEAARAVLDFAPLREIGPAGDTFGEALATLLGDVDLAGAVNCVRLCHTNLIAEIEYDGAHPTRRFFREADIPKILEVGEGGVKAFGTTGILDQAVIGGALIHQFAFDLGHEDDEGAEWGTDAKGAADEA